MCTLYHAASRTGIGICYHNVLMCNTICSPFGKTQSKTRNLQGATWSVKHNHTHTHTHPEHIHTQIQHALQAVLQKPVFKFSTPLDDDTQSCRLHDRHTHTQRSEVSSASAGKEQSTQHRTWPPLFTGPKTSHVHTQTPVVPP